MGSKKTKKEREWNNPCEPICHVASHSQSLCVQLVAEAVKCATRLKVYPLQRASLLLSIVTQQTVKNFSLTPKTRGRRAIISWHVYIVSRLVNTGWLNTWFTFFLNGFTFYLFKIKVIIKRWWNMNVNKPSVVMGCKHRVLFTSQKNRYFFLFKSFLSHKFHSTHFSLADSLVMLRE